MGLLVLGCWLELVNSARNEENQSSVFMSAWPASRSYIFKSSSPPEKPPCSHHELSEAHETLLTTKIGSLNWQDKLWRERVEDSSLLAFA